MSDEPSETAPDLPPFDPDKLDTIHKLAKLGHTDVEIAEFVNTSLATFNRWKGRYPDLVRALKIGKDEADARVVRSLYERAVGYTYPSEKVFSYKGQIVRAPITVHVIPDTLAQIFWLKNRQKADWRDVHQVDHTHRMAGWSDAEVEAEWERIQREEAGEETGALLEGTGKELKR